MACVLVKEGLEAKTPSQGANKHWDVEVFNALMKNSIPDFREKRNEKLRHFRIKNKYF
jgi:hypothetical protein